MLMGPDGEAWLKLRNDDFSDLAEHYTLRGSTSTASHSNLVHASTAVSASRHIRNIQAPVSPTPRNHLHQTSLLSGSTSSSRSSSLLGSDLRASTGSSSSNDGACLPVVSETLMDVIKGMMACDPAKRLGLGTRSGHVEDGGTKEGEGVWTMRVVELVRKGKGDGRLGMALVDEGLEGDVWLESVLGDAAESATG
jgi:hypothetical protein